MRKPYAGDRQLVRPFSSSNWARGAAAPMCYPPSKDVIGGNFKERPPIMNIIKTTLQGCRLAWLVLFYAWTIADSCSSCVKVLACCLSLSLPVDAAAARCSDWTRHALIIFERGRSSNPIQLPIWAKNGGGERCVEEEGNRTHSDQPNRLVLDLTKFMITLFFTFFAVFEEGERFEGTKSEFACKVSFITTKCTCFLRWIIVTSPTCVQVRGGR